jgi:DNA-binding NarL/FixJ family response regulator
MAKGKASTDKRRARILIVDDHPIVRRGLRQLIGSEPDLEVCGEAADAPDAMQKVVETHPDLVIVDISLQSGNGIELIKQIKAYDARIKMLVSSMHEESLYAERSLRAGAMGYVNKEAAPESLIEAIRQVLKGGVYLSGGMTDRLLRRVVTGEDVQRYSVENLSDRELEVFELIGAGLATRQIAEKLHLSIKTIETHRENIKAKLALANSSELARRAVQWVLERR